MIFIDDDLSNLESVKKICGSLDISFHSIHYTAASLASLPVLNKEKEAMRYKILETEYKWLSDQELDARIKKTINEHYIYSTF